MGTFVDELPGETNEPIVVDGSVELGRFDELAEEFAKRFRRGERPRLEEYVDRLPAMADEIREMFPALVEVELAEANARVELLGKPPPVPQLREIGDYRIVREIGRGGMGVVYEAEQISLGRRVALKVLPRQVSSDRMVRERFRREARAAGRLHHTNIVPVYEVGQDGDVRFYAMQFIQGQGLDSVINELRQLRDRSAQVSRLKPLSAGRSSRQRDEHSQGSGGERAARREEIQVSAVLQSILAGLFDPRGQSPVQMDDPGSKPARAAIQGVTTHAGTGIDRPLAASDPALLPTELDDSRRVETIRPMPGLLAPLPSSPASSSSAILPGGTQLSSAESGRHAFFRSLAHIGRQVAGGLAYAHARGIVHRDIKPSNLLLDTEGVVWITDFGLAKGDDEGLTQSGDILGTIRYMAPERFRGESDVRADVYALGLTLYELLTLRSGFSGSDRLKVIEQIKTEEPERPRVIDPRIPRDLETIVLKAIEKDPKARYRSAEAMGEDLRRFLADEPIVARPVQFWERGLKWARRRPALAASITAIIVLLAGILGLGVLSYARISQALQTARGERRKADTERTAAFAAALNANEARREADETNSSLIAAQQELRRTVYATRSNFAVAAWDSADVGRLRSLLDLLRPTSNDPDLRGWEWRYLWHLVHEHRLELKAQDDSFADVAFSPGGKILAGLEARGRIQLWDAQSGKLLRTTGVTNERIRADLAGGVGALAFSPDGRSVAGPGPAQCLMLYAVDSGLPTLSFEGSAGAVQDLAFSPDGRILVAALSAHAMRVWDARDGHLIHRGFGGHAKPVASVAFSPDGQRIASGSYDRTVKVWKLDDPRNPVTTMNGHIDEVRAVAFSPDGQKIASTGLDRSVRIWDVRSGKELALIRGHAGSITSLAFLPSGSEVVTGSADETVRVWDATSGRELREFKGHTDEVRAVAYSAERNEIASGGGDLVVRVWNAASPPQPRTLESPSVLTYGGTVNHVAFSPDGRRLVTGHEDHALRIWELPSGKPLPVITGHESVIENVAFSPDGRTIASSSADRTIRLWDATTRELKFKLNGKIKDLRGLVFTPDGQTLFSAGPGNTIQAWDPTTGEERFVLSGHSGRVQNLAVARDGRTLASAADDKTCILWNLTDTRTRVTLRGHTDMVNTAAFSPDGRVVATSSNDDTVRLWNTADGSLLRILEGHIDDVYGLAFSPDGRLASSSKDRTIRLWDPASGQTLLVLKGHAARIRCIQFSPDGRTLASASDDRTLKLWEAAPETALASKSAAEIHAGSADSPPRMTSEELRPAWYANASNLAQGAWDANDMRRLRFLVELMKPVTGQSDLRGWEWQYLNGLAAQERLTFRDHDREVSGAAFSPDGRTVASLQWGGRVRLWDPASGKTRLTLEAKQPPVRDPLIAGVSALDWSPDGARLAGPGPNFTLGIWSTQTGRLIVNFSVSSTGSQTVDFSPDGRSIVTGSASKKVRVWDTTDGKLLCLFENAHDQYVHRVAFRPDGRRVASSSEGAIKLWDIEAARMHSVLPCPGVQIFGLAFSPDGRTLVSGGSDQAVQFRDGETGQARGKLWKLNSAITALAYSPDGHRLASAGSDAVVRLWEIETGRVLRTFKGHTDRVSFVSFSPDGNTLVSSSFDKTVKLWDVSGPSDPLVLGGPGFPADQGSAHCVALSADGLRVASGHADGVIRIRDVATGQIRFNLTGHEKAVADVAFSPSGKAIASAGFDGSVRLWDAASGGLRFRLAEHKAQVTSVRFSPDGGRVVSSSDDGTIKVWNAETGQRVLAIRTDTATARRAQFSPDGRVIASIASNGRIELRDAETGRPLSTTIGDHPSAAIDFTLSPDGKRIAVCYRDKKVMIWDTSTQRLALALNGQAGEVESVLFSPDGRRLLTGGRDHSVRIWDLTSGQSLLTLQTHSSEVRSVSFSGDGRQIAALGNDGTIILWGTTSPAQAPLEKPASPVAP